MRSGDPRLGHDGSGNISVADVADVLNNFDEETRIGSENASAARQDEQAKPGTEVPSEANVDSSLDALAAGPGRCCPPLHRHALSSLVC